jgi:hypothetical protein
MIGHISWNKSLLLLKNILHSTQKLQPCTMNIKWKIITKVIKMPGGEAGMERPIGLIKRESGVRVPKVRLQKIAENVSK